MRLLSQSECASAATYKATRRCLDAILFLWAWSNVCTVSIRFIPLARASLPAESAKSYQLNSDSKPYSVNCVATCSALGVLYVGTVFVMRFNNESRFSVTSKRIFQHLSICLGYIFTCHDGVGSGISLPSASLVCL